MTRSRLTYIATHYSLEVLDTVLFLALVTVLGVWIAGISDRTSSLVLYFSLVLVSFSLKYAENKFKWTTQQRECLEGVHGFFMLACGWTLPAAVIVWLLGLESIQVRLAILVLPIASALVIIAGLYVTLFVSFLFWKRRLPKKRPLGVLIRRGFGRAHTTSFEH